MSKDFRRKIYLYYPNENPFLTEIDDIEYKDMMRALRAVDGPKDIWLRSCSGRMFNMSLVKSFHVEETYEVK